MNTQRMTAAVATAALLLGMTAGPALADKGGNGKGASHKPRISQKFEDMSEFGWGLNDVTKLEAKGVFKGRGEHLFAPGAKVTHQEVAVAAVRLMGQEATATALSAADVDALLKDMPDQSSVASWARPAVALLVKLNAIPGNQAFAPLSDASRLDVAVLLAKAMGYEAEAQAKMKATLSFKDASLIPANLVGYVAVAVDHKLITGYEDRTFRPNQAVKRVELAVMMGRADDLIDRHREDDLKGTVKAVSVTSNALTITLASGQDVTVALAEEASVFVDKAEKTLADVTAGMTVEAKLNDQGEAVMVDAKSAAAVENNTVKGSISAITPASATSLGLVTVNAVIYPVSATATITVDSAAAAFADLKVGDNVALTQKSGLATSIAVTRVQTVNGSISAITAANGTTPAQITVNGTAYTLAATATYTINGVAAAFADIKAGDTAALTVTSGQVSAVAVTRTIVTTSLSGSLVSLTPATATAPAQIFFSYVKDGAVTTATYSVQSTVAITVNGTAAQFADLHLGDSAKLTFQADALTKIEVTR